MKKEQEDFCANLVLYMLFIVIMFIANPFDCVHGVFFLAIGTIGVAMSFFLLISSYINGKRGLNGQGKTR